MRKSSLLFLTLIFAVAPRTYSAEIRDRSHRSFGEFAVVASSSLTLRCGNKYRTLKVPGYCLLTLEEKNVSKKKHSVISTGESCRWKIGRTVEADIGNPNHCLLGSFICDDSQTVYRAPSLDDLYSLYFGKKFMLGYRHDGKNPDRVFKYYDRSKKKFVINSDPKIVEARERYAFPAN